MQNAGINRVFFDQDRLEEMAAFLVSIIFNGGKYVVENGPNAGWTVEIIK